MRAFTLIELLVVMVILGLFSGMVVISIGDSFQRKALAEAERLQSLIIAASDEAIFTANEFGFYFTDTDYQVLRWDRFSQGWVATASQAFKTHSLPDGMVMRVSVEGFAVPMTGDEQGSEVVELEFGDDTESVSFGEDKSERDEESLEIVDLKPQILTLSSAELSVFSVVFEAADEPAQRAAYELKCDGFTLPRVRQIGSLGEGA